MVTVNLTPASGPPLSLRIDIGSYAVNQLLSGDPQLFVMPQSAAKMVDLTTISGIVPTSAAIVAPVDYSADRLPPIPMRGTTK